MKVLVIGGTVFTGPYTVRSLHESGHEVTVFNRGVHQASFPVGVRKITGDKANLRAHWDELRKLRADVVLHMVAMRRDESREFMSLFDGVTGRVVAISSIDVYAAYARIHRTEPGAVQPIPISEDAELRQAIEPQGESYDKIGVEEEFRSCPGLPATILRFPAVYGPRDGLRRLHEYLKRMDDGRPFVLLEKGNAAWRFSRGYSENVSAAVVLAVTDDRASGRTYNVAEPEAFPEAEWVRSIGRIAGWDGEIMVLPPEAMPDHLKSDGNMAQHWAVDSYRIRQELGYHEIVSREDALRTTIEWERNNPPPDTFAIYPFDYPAEDAAVERFRGGSV